MSEVVAITTDQLYQYIQFGLGVAGLAAIGWRIVVWYKKREKSMREHLEHVSENVVNKVMNDNKHVEERLLSKITDVHNCVEKLEEKIDVVNTSFETSISDLKGEVKDLKTEVKEHAKAFNDHNIISERKIAEFDSFKNQLFAQKSFKRRK